MTSARRRGLVAEHDEGAIEVVGQRPERVDAGLQRRGQTTLWCMVADADLVAPVDGQLDRLGAVPEHHDRGGWPEGAHLAQHPSQHAAARPAGPAASLPAPGRTASRRQPPALRPRGSAFAHPHPDPTRAISPSEATAATLGPWALVSRHATAAGGRQGRYGQRSSQISARRDWPRGSGSGMSPR